MHRPIWEKEGNFYGLHRNVQGTHIVYSFNAFCKVVIRYAAINGKTDKATLVTAIKQADKECGSCGCNLDPLYKKSLELL